MIKNNNKDHFKNVLSETLKIDKWIDHNGWKGWDPYDIKGHNIFVKISNISKGSFAYLINGITNNTIDLFPLYLRKIFNIQPAINSKALGLLLSSYCNLYNVTNDEEYLRKGIDVANWLIKNKNVENIGIGWGYPFDWYSPIFIPKNTSTSIPTVVIGDAFYRLYKTTNDEKYLTICKDICLFLMNGLHVTYNKNNSLCYSYTPLDDYQVHNSNLFIGELLTRVGKELAISEFYDNGIKCGNFALIQQQEEGFLPYWGIDQTLKYSDGLMHTDHYHCGFEIRALFGMWLNTGQERFKLAYEKYLNWYIKNLYENNTFPKFTPTTIYPIYTHSCSESIFCLATLLRKHDNLDDLLKKSYCWTIQNMQHSSGEYIHMIKKVGKIFNKKIKITMFRHAQAWMLMALSEYLVSLNQTEVN